MKSAQPHAGVIVPLVTPATADGRLDDAAAARLVEHVASHGCGLLVAGTTGEVASLPDAARRRYVEIAVRVAAHRVPVFACVAHNCFEHAAALGRDHLRAGADAVVAMLPNYFKLEPVEMQCYFAQLANAIAGPFYLYNMPLTTGMSVPLDVVDALSRHPHILGMKDSEGTPGRREAVAARFASRPDFALFMGVAAHGATALRLGFRGVVPSSGNLRPALWRDLCRAAQAGDWPRVDALQQKTDALAALYQPNRSLGQSLAALKAGCEGAGLCGATMFSPLTPLEPTERAAVCERLAQFT